MFNLFNRVFSLLLCITLVISLTACNVSFKPPAEDNSSAPVSNDTTHESDTNSTEKPITDNSKPESNSSKDPIITSTPEQSVSSPTVELPEAPTSEHTPLSKEDYYQYISLSDSDKKVYNTICKGIEAQQNYIDVKKYDLTDKKLKDILDKVIADNPQYFWVSKFMQYSIITTSNKRVITDLILFYTDGTVTDNISDSGKFITIADRNKIKEQKIVFDNKVSEFLKTFSSDLPEIEKERYIHDFVLSAITYDDSYSGKAIQRDNYPRVYDTFGALVNGKAVCEGYTRLFQYLCYQVGINSTFVNGESKGEGHAWNTVKLDGEWYHVDTTWDDGHTGGIPLYTYFNLTEEEINTDHTIDSSVLKVPNATANTLCFTNTFGILINDTLSAPQNYEKAIDYMVKFNSKYLMIKYNGAEPNDLYIRLHFLSQTGSLQKYIKAQGYNISFKPTYFTLPNYIILEKE